MSWSKSSVLLPVEDNGQWDNGFGLSEDIDGQTVKPLKSRDYKRLYYLFFLQIYHKL